ncbi:MAG TPA: hypothetical protein VLW17_06665 [Thermoanaerobaculaceae bacterium]|nr:hypothetical protein [Thermoanaerobaculaceae bacterium]
MSPGAAAAALVPAVLLAGALALFWLDRFRLEPLPWLLGALVWSCGLAPALRWGCALAGVAAPPPLGFDRWAVPGAAATAAAVIALVVPLLLATRSRALEGPAGGLALGAVAGSALAASALLPPAPHADPASAAAAVSAVLGGAAVGATFGTAVGVARLTVPPRTRPLAWAGALLAAGLEFAALAFARESVRRAWGAGAALPQVALALVGAGLLAAAAGASLALERRVIHLQLAEEVELGVLPAWVLELVPFYSRRVRGDWWPRRDERQEIVRLLVALAFRKHQLRHLSAERLRLYGLEVGRLRQRARTLIALAPERPAAAG